MKLRNKRTGEIVEAESCNSYSGTIGLFFEKGRETDRAYETLAELNEEWEDYTPKEPLIKDEKIRKAVRAWAEACDIKSCYLEFGMFCTKHREINYYIGFGDSDYGFSLEEKHYTIAELCGEEEK